MHIYHVNPSHADTFLRSKGVFTIQDSSWTKEGISKRGVKSLVLAALNGVETNAGGDVHSSTVRCALPRNKAAGDALQKYFGSFCLWIADDVNKKLQKNINSNIIVFNFMPFALVKSIVHKFLLSLREVVLANAFFNKPSVRLVFLAQNSESFLGCWVTELFNNNPNINATFHLVDYRGYTCDCSTRSQRKLDRSLYADTIRIDDKELYDKLIYGTNNYIGHYKLSGAHVRTHYDLTDFVRNNDVNERILSKIYGLVKDYESVWIVYVGIEQDALYGLCSNVTNYIHHPFTQVYSSDNIEKRLRIQQPACVLLLSDIVCSGDTLLQLKVRVESSRDTLGQQFDIVPFSIIRMENSPNQLGDIPLESLLEIRRGFYKHPDEECKLCQVRQPDVDVNNARDFRVITSHFTPYDFWEIVHDCKALKVREKERSGRQLEVRVETDKIFSRYRHWLHNIVRAQYIEKLPKLKPNIVLTVQEVGGVSFSEIICEALLLDKDIIAAVERGVLNVHSNHSSLKDKSRFSGKRVLLVDDGINGGSTMKMLNDYCITRGGTPIGVFVFDSRLEEQQVESLRSAMGRSPIMSLYRWPGTAKLCEI